MSELPACCHVALAAAVAQQCQSRLVLRCVLLGCWIEIPILTLSNSWKMPLLTFSSSTTASTMKSACFMPCRGQHSTAQHSGTRRRAAQAKRGVRQAAAVLRLSACAAPAQHHLLLRAPGWPHAVGVKQHVCGSPLLDKVHKAGVPSPSTTTPLRCAAPRPRRHCIARLGA